MMKKLSLHALVKGNIIHTSIQHALNLLATVILPLASRPKIALVTITKPYEDTG